MPARTQPLLQCRVDAGLPAVACGAKLLHHIVRKADGDAFLGGGSLRSAHAQFALQGGRQFSGRLQRPQRRVGERGHFAAGFSQASGSGHTCMVATYRMHRKLSEIPAPRHQIAQQRREVAQVGGDQVADFAAAFHVGLNVALHQRACPAAASWERSPRDARPTKF